jgi:hypothetical protein
MEALLKKFKKMTTPQLLVKVGKLSGEELEACVCVLEIRGADVGKYKELTPVTETVEIVNSVGPIYEYESEDELTAEEQVMLDKAEADLKLQKKEPKTEIIFGKISLCKAPVKGEVIPVTSSDSLEHPEGVKKGDLVNFAASMRSKVPGEILTGKVKRFYFDKQDQCDYFVIAVGEKDYCKRPKAVTKA